MHSFPASLPWALKNLPPIVRQLDSEECVDHIAHFDDFRACFDLAERRYVSRVTGCCQVTGHSLQADNS